MLIFTCVVCRDSDIDSPERTSNGISVKHKKKKKKKKKRHEDERTRRSSSVEERSSRKRRSRSRSHERGTSPQDTKRACLDNRPEYTSSTKHRQLNGHIGKSAFTYTVHYVQTKGMATLFI